MTLTEVLSKHFELYPSKVLQPVTPEEIGYQGFTTNQVEFFHRRDIASDGRILLVKKTNPPRVTVGQLPDEEYAKYGLSAHHIEPRGFTKRRKPGNYANHPLNGLLLPNNNDIFGNDILSHKDIHKDSDNYLRDMHISVDEAVSQGIPHWNMKYDPIMSDVATVNTFLTINMQSFPFLPWCKKDVVNAFEILQELNPTFVDECIDLWTMGSTFSEYQRT